MKKLIILGLILGLALLVRTYRILEPLADWHSWRQADTAAVTRRYVLNGIDLLHPTYDDLSSIPSGKENPQGYRMVEFPFVNGLTAFAYNNLSVVRELQIHVFSRIISILFSLGSLVFLYLLVDRLSGALEATLSALVFALLPYNIFYSRVVLPEVPMVFFSLGAVYFMVNKLVKGKTWASFDFFASAAFAALAILLKPYVIFLGLPLGYLKFKTHGLKVLKQKSILLYLLICLAPFVAWRFWIRQFPEGIPAFTWLLNGNGIRFKGAWFRWLFADRIGRLILGYWGLIPLGLGLIKAPKNREGLFYHFWALAILIYLSVFATGNVQHDYYQTLTIPILSIFVAKGLAFLLKPPRAFNRLASYSLLIVSFAFMLAFGWFHIRDFYNINHPEIVEAGQRADEILPPDAKVIAPYGGDTAFLYQTNRQGWPIGGNVEDKIKLGATEYVTTTLDDEAQMLMKACRPFLQTEKYLILSLRDCEF